MANPPESCGANDARMRRTVRKDIKVGVAPKGLLLNGIYGIQLGLSIKTILYGQAAGLSDCNGIIFLFRNKDLNIFTKCNGISELIVTSLVQFDFYDVILLNAL